MDDATVVSRNVLVLDDSLSDLFLISERLKSQYTLSTATNVDDALAIVEAGRPLYCILTDLVMPMEQERNGLDFIRMLRTRALPIPIVAMSGEANSEISAFAIKEGAIDFIDKIRLKAPQNDEELASTITRLEKNVREFHQKYDEEQKLRIRGTMDKVTGLYNRYQFEDDLKKEIARHNRHMYRKESSTLSLIFLDINDMNRANGALGHDYVDINLLGNAGRAIEKSLLRDLDRGYRYGGDELVAILPETDLDGAIRVAERIIQEYESRKNSFRYETYATTTPTPCDKKDFEQWRHQYGQLSIGAVQAPLVDIEQRELVTMADIATYHAKRKGKLSEIHLSTIIRYEEGMQYPPENEMIGVSRKAPGG